MCTPTPATAILTVILGACFAISGEELPGRSETYRILIVTRGTIPITGSHREAIAEPHFAAATSLPRTRRAYSCPWNDDAARRHMRRPYCVTFRIEVSSGPRGLTSWFTPLPAQRSSPNISEATSGPKPGAWNLASTGSSEVLTAITYRLPP